MPIQEIDAAIAELEIQLQQFESMLDQSIQQNEIFAKTKIIYQDLKAVSEKLKQLKKLKEEK